jgi:hypothetical protein
LGRKKVDFCCASKLADEIVDDQAVLKKSSKLMEAEIL